MTLTFWKRSINGLLRQRKEKTVGNKIHEPHIFGKHHCGFIHVGDGYGYWEYVAFRNGDILLTGF